MKHSLWIKFTHPPSQNECTSRLTGLDGEELVDNLCKMFHKDCNAMNRCGIGPGELLVFNVNDNGSDDGSKMHL